MLKGLQCIIGRFQTQSAIFKFSDVMESLTAKQRDRLLSFLILNVMEAKIFDHVFLEGPNVWQNSRYWSSTQRNVVANNMVACERRQPEFLVAKYEILAALSTVPVALSSF